jgi:hypothetical protein
MFSLGEKVTGANVLVAIFEQESQAVCFLKQQMLRVSVSSTSLMDIESRGRGRRVG